VNINWVSQENHLLLNPRLSQETREVYERAWSRLELNGQVGIVTSGSTSVGFGRLIIISKNALLMSAHAVNTFLQSTKNDVWMKTLPNFHVGGLGIYTRAHLSGATVVESQLSRWDATDFFDELVISRATLLSLVPTQVFDLVKTGFHGPPSLRAIIVGGGRLDAELAHAATALGWPVLPSYGLTECGSQVATAFSSDDQSLRPLSHVEIRIAKDDHIEIRSAALLTAQISFAVDGTPSVSDPKHGGWFRTEDRGRLEEDGSLTVFGRSQDFVKIGGEGVALPQLEEKLERLRMSSGFESEAVLLAVADERLGAKIILVSNAPEASALTLVESFNSAVLPFERIRATFCVPAIPRSALGKLLRGETLALVGLKPVVNV
jgi:o-succinylbenzoate---CoA ligase